MKNKKRILALFIFLFFFVNGLIASPIKILSSQVISQPHHWRVIFESSSSINYHAFVLKNPNRLVIDLKNTKLIHPIRQTQLVNTPIMRIRYGRKPPLITRMVFDLNYPVNAKIYVLPKSQGHPDRLVVDLQGKNQAVLAFSWPLKKSEPSAILKTRKEVIPSEHPPNNNKLRDIVIVVDPGHGGKDPGATGRWGTHEKTIVLAISKILQKLINEQPGFKAYLTRNGDYYLTLRQRLEIARKDKADMFVAIHADAWRNTTASGASVFALSERGATSEAARWLAARENKSELMGGVKLSDKTNLLKSVLINLSQTATIRASLDIGRDIINALRMITGLHHSKVEQAAFVVLKSPDIPSLLIETGFLSNPYEEQRLLNPGYRDHIANAIMKGIIEYFKEEPPRGSRLSAEKYHPELLRDERFIHYKVERGDTLLALSEHFRVSMKALKKLNHLKKDQLYIGERIKIPHR